jgi:hypothetical protein
MVQESHFGQEFAECPGLNIIIVCLADFSHPTVRRTIVGDVKFQSLEHYPLALENFLFRVSILGHENEFVDRWGEDLLIFGGDEHCGHAHKLELKQGDNPLGEESIYDVHGYP